MSDWHELPSHRNDDETLSVDEVKLVRDDAPVEPAGGVISAAFQFVKDRPGETILFGFLQTLFGGGGSRCFNPSGLTDLANPGGGTGNEYDNADSILGVVGGLFGIAGGELAIIAILIVVFVLVFAFVLVLQAGIQGGAQLFWLRLVRGQDAELSHAGRVIPLLIPLIFTNLLMWFIIMGGYLALIIPGIMLTLGFQFVGLVVLDKNLHYVDALKASWRMTSGHKWELLVLVILLGLLNFAGVLACCVGVFVTTAIATGALVIMYDRIAEPGNAYLELGEDVMSAFD